MSEHIPDVVLDRWEQQTTDPATLMEIARIRTAQSREGAVAVLAEMERHAPLPNPVAFYAIKLREALGVVGPLTCTCGGCTRG